MTRSARERLADAQIHFEAAIRYSEDGEAGNSAGQTTLDQKTVDAMCMRIAAGIESLHAIPTEKREELFGNAWPTMWGMRNRIAHTYSRVEGEVILATVRLDLPQLLTVIREELGD